MNQLIYDIFDTLVHNHPEMKIADKAITTEINNLLEPYKEQLTMEELETFRNMLFSVSYCSKREAFAVGFHYALELLLSKKLCKLNSLISKYDLKGRKLQCLIIPELEEYVLDYYVTRLTGKGIYVTLKTAKNIINSSDYTQTKKDKLIKVIQAVSDKHGYQSRNHIRKNECTKNNAY